MLRANRHFASIKAVAGTEDFFQAVENKLQRHEKKLALSNKIRTKRMLRKELQEAVDKGMSTLHPPPPIVHNASHSDCFLQGILWLQSVCLMR